MASFGASMQFSIIWRPAAHSGTRLTTLIARPAAVTGSMTPSNNWQSTVFVIVKPTIYSQQAGKGMLSWHREASFTGLLMPLASLWQQSSVIRAIRHGGWWGPLSWFPHHSVSGGILAFDRHSAGAFKRSKRPCILWNLILWGNGAIDWLVKSRFPKPVAK